MNNSELLQLVATQGELAQKALLLQECGVIKDVSVYTNVSSTSIEVSVKLDQYSSTEKKWCAEQKFFGDDQSLHGDEESLAKLRKYVDEEIERLNKRSLSIIGRIEAIINNFKK